MTSDLGSLIQAGIEGQIAHGDTFHADRFPDLKHATAAAVRDNSL